MKIFVHWAKYMEIPGGEIWTLWQVLPQFRFQIICSLDRLIGRMRTDVVMQQDGVLSKFSTAFGSDRGLLNDTEL
jgi:hypothetical protein